MNGSRHPLRLGFRTQLALTIAVVFIAAGAALLVVQNLIVRALFDHAIDVSGACISVRNDDGTATRSCAAGNDIESFSSAMPEGPGLGDAILQQSTMLNDVVSGGLLSWSTVVLVAFAIVAAVCAHWLSKRALRRIADITATANAISEQDLGRRLDLPGPDDEVKELGDTIDGMLDRLQTAFAAQDRFVANASHELRTPLSTVRASLEIPLIHGKVPEDLQPAIRRALRANARSEHLITSLLALARGQSGRINEQRIRVDHLVKADLDEAAEFAADRMVSVEATIAPNLPAIVGDSVLLGQAIRNLVDNAIRHNRQGGEVAAEVTAQGDCLVIEVANTGEAISDAEVALLVEPFHRGEATRTVSNDSIGLGLAIVASIATAHGGELVVSPRRPDGLAVRLTLPYTST